MSSTANSHQHHDHRSRLPPSHLKSHDNGVKARLAASTDAATAGSQMAKEVMDLTTSTGAAAVTSGGEAEEDPRIALFKQLYLQSEARITALFGQAAVNAGKTPNEKRSEGEHADGGVQARSPSNMAPKKAARVIDEDDYDDYGAEDNDEDGVPGEESQEKPNNASPRPPSRKSMDQSMTQNAATTKDAPSQAQAKSSEEVREKLQEDRKAAEEAAKGTFHTLFYTLENDRDAMLEQQKLEELDRQVDAEMSGQGGHGHNANNVSAGNPQHGKLSSANLGASSLTLKHLIARIDAKRNQVRASDAELRNLMSEVRKNRSKWANEERVGQEELYEAAEKVLSELKAMTEHSQPFLTRVNKRDAPDYYNSKFRSPPTLE